MGKKIKRLIRNLVFLVFIVIIFSLGIMTFWVANMRIPSLDTFEERRVDQSTKVYDRTGDILLFDVFKDTKRVVVPFDEISSYIKYATLAAEDQDFYLHRGVHPRAFLRAVWINLSEREMKQGGSTITQQVVKNSVLTPDKEISRKIKEWIFSVRLEQVMSKDDIFNLYLNETPYGGSVYGVEQAARSYFGKTAAEVTAAEAAYLAALPQAPTYLSPHGSHRDKLEARQNFILQEMRNNEFLTAEEYQTAQEEEVEFLPPEEQGIRAPHFVMYVLEHLAEEYGRDILEQHGLEITTTLDYQLQDKAQNLAQRYSLENEQKFDAENIGVSAVDPQTGEILVMVGSRDYFDESIDGNYNITTAKRQPGSAFKPFAYAEAFNKGYTPDTILFDLRTQFSTTCGPNQFTSADSCYSPQNYDLSFRGPMTMRDALAQSVNIPAVKTLYLAGAGDTAGLAEKMGVQDLQDLRRYGLTLVLGGGEVALLDMVSAYGVFAGEGERVPPTPILKITQRDGEVLYEYEPKKERVLDQETARLITDVLSDNTARAPMFGLNSPLHFPGEYVAAKTGTTNNYRDAWIIGYSNNIVIGAWAGNNDNRPMRREVAGMVIAPMWNELMIEVLQDRSSTPFNKPVYLSQDKSGLKPILRGEWQIPKNIKEEEEETQNSSVQIHSILHWVNRTNPHGSIPRNPAGDSQYPLWEYPVRSWADAQGFNQKEEGESLDESEEEND